MKSANRYEGVFRKIGQDIMRNICEGNDRDWWAPEVSPVRLRSYMSDRRVPDSAAKSVARRYPQLRQALSKELTWVELHALASQLPKAGQLRPLINREQLYAAKQDLGLPRALELSPQQVDTIAHLLSLEDPDTTDLEANVDLTANDIVIVRGEYANTPDISQAYTTGGNIVTLLPCFFRQQIDGWLNESLIPSTTEVALVAWAPKTRTLLHELMHTPSVSACIDHEISEKAVQDLAQALGAEPPKVEYGPDPEACARYKTTGKTGCYGLNDCVWLAQLDNYHDTAYAEENADNWATFGALYMLTMQYPEFDFSGEKVERREALLHHCSGFDCLRHPEHGSIKDLPGYNQSLDLWYCEYGDYMPKTVKELLIVVRDIAKDLAPSIEDILKEAGLDDWDDTLFGESAYDFESGGRWRTPLTARPRAS